MIAMSGQAAGLWLCAIGVPVAAWQTWLGHRDRKRDERRATFVRNRDGL